MIGPCRSCDFTMWGLYIGSIHA